MPLFISLLLLGCGLKARGVDISALAIYKYSEFLEAIKECQQPELVPAYQHANKTAFFPATITTCAAAAIAIQSSSI